MKTYATQAKFKSYMMMIAFHFKLMLMGKAWIYLFFPQL